MKCPYCGTEMQKGYLHDHSQPVQWIPEGKKPSAWKGVPAKEGITLGEGSLWDWDGYRADAFYCPTCKIVIASVK